MHILKIGLAKSGNFWLHTILHNIIEHSGLKYESFIENQPIYEIAKTWGLNQIKDRVSIDVLDITKNALFYRIGNIFRYPVDDIDDYINGSTLVWTHAQMSSNALNVIQKFDKLVYIVRDPRDLLISWSNFVFTPYIKRYYPYVISDEIDSESYLNNNLKTIINDWMNHVGAYLKYQKDLNIHFVFYERLLDDFDRELEEILEYLEIELDAKARGEIKEKVSFNQMKKESPNHLRKGQLGQWVDILTDAQKEEVLQMATPLLKLLNYPLNSQVDSLPALPEKLPENINLPDGKVVILKPSNH
ncbi:MAG: sulfotransferase domain-containing protein [Okeania sp. SIO2C2]|uniref:sulfotransferase domain-containing protein n=1 Tax=Okeania sp. SIO2C2 TaxID=2607787 RepID=UPI0013B65509|nr:sulfotransferase domain-containing protein [Okeania sp. SIO2C2]NEP90056.1 sulfotransferase domain-containing protein [Okeania sp. SIO2C2]